MFLPQLSLFKLTQQNTGNCVAYEPQQFISRHSGGEAERSKVKRGLGRITDGGLSSGHRWYILLVLIGRRGEVVF